MFILCILNCVGPMSDGLYADLSLTSVVVSYVYALCTVHFVYLSNCILVCYNEFLITNEGIKMKSNCTCTTKLFSSTILSSLT